MDYRYLRFVVGLAVISIYCLVQAFRGIVLRSAESNPIEPTMLTGHPALVAGSTWLLVGLIAGGLAGLMFWLKRD